MIFVRTLVVKIFLNVLMYIKKFKVSEFEKNSITD